MDPDTQQAHAQLDAAGIPRTTHGGRALPLWYRVARLRERAESVGAAPKPTARVFDGLQLGAPLVANG